MKTQTIQFGEWMPDQPDLGNGVTVVNNAIPQAKSWRSVPSLEAVSDALTAKALRGFWAKDSSNATYFFAGDANDLYSLSSGSFTNVTKGGTPGIYSATSWEFVKFGDRVIATSLEENTQYYDMGSSTDFADLAGSPPKAKRAAVVRDFIVLGYLDDGTTRPNRLQWSAYNDSEDWSPSLATQSDFQDLFGNGGEIQRIVPGEYGVVFQNNAIWKMTYVGPPIIFQLDEVSTGRGTPAANSVTWLGRYIFFWGNDGFYLFDGFNEPIPIGNEKVDRYVANDLDTSQIDDFYGTIDPKNKLVFWAYPSLSKGRKRIIVYNWAIKKWGLIDQDVDCLVTHASTAYTLDGLDSILADIDSASISVDSTAYLGGSLNVAAFDTDHKLKTFTGAAMDGELETGELSAGGKRVKILSVRPLSDGTPLVSVGTRDDQNDNYIYGTEKAVNSVGECNVLTNTRFPRFKMKNTGGFSHAQGLEVRYREAGRR